MVRLRPGIQGIALVGILLLASFAVPSIPTLGTHIAGSPNPLTTRKILTESNHALSIVNGPRPPLGELGLTSTNTTILSAISVLPGGDTIATEGVQIFTSVVECTNGSSAAACPSKGIDYSWNVNNSLGVILITTGPSVLFTAGNTSGLVNLSVMATLNGSVVKNQAMITIVYSPESAANIKVLIAVLLIVVAVAVMAMIVTMTRRKIGVSKPSQTRRKDSQPASPQAAGTPVTPPKDSLKSPASTASAKKPIKDPVGRSAIPCPGCHTLAEEGTQVCQVCGYPLANAWKSVNK